MRVSRGAGHVAVRSLSALTHEVLPGVCQARVALVCGGRALQSDAMDADILSSPGRPCANSRCSKDAWRLGRRCCPTKAVSVPSPHTGLAVRVPNLGGDCAYKRCSSHKLSPKSSRFVPKRCCMSARRDTGAHQMWRNKSTTTSKHPRGEITCASHSLALAACRWLALPTPSRPSTRAGHHRLPC